MLPWNRWMPTRPVLILNPRDDAEFVDFAEDLVEHGTLDARELQGKLRTRYSKAVVRPRDLSSERTAVWYVYREGSWVPSTRREEG
jgi:hypothetical protein